MGKRRQPKKAGAEPVWLSSQEVAELVGKLTGRTPTTRAVLKWQQDGLIAGERQSGRAWRFDRAKVVAALEANRLDSGHGGVRENAGRKKRRSLAERLSPDDVELAKGIAGAMTRVQAQIFCSSAQGMLALERVRALRGEVVSVAHVREVVGSHTDAARRFLERLPETLADDASTELGLDDAQREHLRRLLEDGVADAVEALRSMEFEPTEKAAGS